jgi:WD40 repeat protein
VTVEPAAPPLAAPAVDEPYVGLTHFTEEHVDRFFGRETESALVIGNLRASRLTLLYAESGVGKSSVLRAGVVARLREYADRDLRGRGSPRLVPVVFSSWSERPVAALVHALGEAVRPYLPGEGDIELPEADLEAALEAASEALDATVLVILDQFEEYFLYPDEEPEQGRIAAQVARCVNRLDLRANFLISIREDAYAELGDLFRGKVKNVYGNFLHLDFLDPAGAREAIERPIERVNELRPDAEPCAVEPALVEAVLDQVGHDEAEQKIETTYLQLVMRRLWEEEAGSGSRALRLRTLEALGGAQAIIGNHLDRAMADDTNGGGGLSADQRRIAASVFRFLVTSGGTKIALTAHDLADLSGIPEAEIDPVLQHLSSPKLHILRPVVLEGEGSEPRFEIFHDALAGPIVKWRTEVEEGEREARVERERAEKEEAQRAAAEAERQAARERQRKRLAQVALGVAVFALLAGAVFFAAWQKRLADEQESERESVQAAERISELAWAPSFGPAPAALAGVEAYELSSTSEARERTLAQLQLNPGLPEIAAGHTRGVESVAFWPGSDRFVSGGDETLRLWNGQGGEVDGPLAAGGAVLEVAVGGPRDGAHVIAAGLQSGEVKLWEVPEGGEPQEPPRTISGSPNARGVAFNPRDPAMLAVGGRGGEVTLWDLGDPGKPRRIDAGSAPGDVEDLAFAADGSRLLVAGSEGGAVFELSKAGFEGSVPEIVVGGEEFAVATAPDGSYAFGGKGGVQLWSGGKRVGLSLPGRVNALAFAQRGAVLVAAGSDWNVTTWDVASRRPFGPPRAANRAAVNDVAVSSNGEIAAAGDDRLVKVWPLEDRRALAATLGALTPGEAGGYVPKLFDVAGSGRRKIATAAGRAGTLIWPEPAWQQTNRVLRLVDRIPGRSFSVASHGAMLVTGRGNSFVVYGTGEICEGGEKHCRLDAPDRPHSDRPVNGLVFARHGDRLLLASAGGRGEKGVVDLWDLTTVADGGRLEHLFSLPTSSPVLGIGFAREKPLVAATTKSGELALWDIGDPQDPQEVEVRRREDRPLYAAAFSPDSSLLAAGGQGQQVMLWQVGEESGRLTVSEMPGTLLQRQSITSLTFSPDGETLAAADAEGNICLYGVDNRHLIGDSSCLRGYNVSALENGGIEAMKFAHFPNEVIALLTVGQGQPLVAWHSLLWNLNDTERVAEAIKNRVCALAGRNLKEYEWNSVFASTKLAGDLGQTCPQHPVP